MKSEILLHLLYTSLSLSVFYLIFWLFLRKSTHFTLNRAYLVLSMVLSITLPLVNVPQLGFYRNVDKVTLIPDETISRNSSKVVPQVDLNVNGETKKETTPDITSAIGFTSLFFWLYSTGLALMLSRLLMMVSSLWSLYRSARFKTLPDGTRLVITHKIKAPSSFFNLLFIPESGISDNDIHSIIAHEQVHIWQYHSLDILLAELTVAFLWFNPFSWLFKRAIRNVHEYLADEGVVHQGIHPRQYQMLLLKYAVDKTAIPEQYTQSAGLKAPDCNDE